MNERGAARILVVDDNPLITRLLRAHLEAEGYEVSVAYDGREALAQVWDARPDLVVLDVHLPGHRRVAGISSDAGVGWTRKAVNEVKFSLDKLCEFCYNYNTYRGRTDWWVEVGRAESAAGAREAIGSPKRYHLNTVGVWMTV